MTYKIRGIFIKLQKFILDIKEKFLATYKPDKNSKQAV